MKNKRFTVSTAELNTGVVQELDTLLEIDESTFNKTQITKYYPKKIQLINKSGVDVTVNIFSDDEEYQEYVDGKPYYDMFTVLNNSSTILTSNNILPPAKKIIVQKASGTATSDFIVETIQYIPAY